MSTTTNTNSTATLAIGSSTERIPTQPEFSLEIKPKENQVRISHDNLTKSTALELKLTEEIHHLKKQMNQKENEYKKDKAVLEQNIDLLKLQIQEYKKREENLKKMNETIMSSLNDIACQGNNSKIFKEIQLNYEQHNKELVESRGKLQQTINTLENENRTLKDQINEMKLHIKDLEISVEKEKINNERAYEVNILDRTQMENDIQKQHLITEEGYHKERLALESRIQEASYAKDSQLLEMREKYEEKIRLLQIGFDKEKNGLEARIQKNLNTIRKYQTHMEQNVSMNQSTLLANQSKLDISCIKTETDVELRSEILKINNEKAKLNLDLQHQIQQTYQKDEQILKLQSKITELNKQLEELKQKLSLYENNGDSSSRTFISTNNLQPMRDGQNTPQQQSPIQINRSTNNLSRNQRSVSTNNLGANQNIQNSQNMPLQMQSKGLRESMKQSQVKQKISNHNQSNIQFDVINDSKTNVYQSQIYQNGLSETQLQDYDNSLENIAAVQSYPQSQANQFFNNQGQQQQPNNVYMQLQQQFQMSQDGNILQDTQQQQKMYALQQSTNNIFNQSQPNNNYVQPFQNTIDNNILGEPLADTTQLLNQFGNQNFIQTMDGQPFTPNQDNYVNFINQQDIDAYNYNQNQQLMSQNTIQDLNDMQVENRKRSKKNQQNEQENRTHSPIVNGKFKTQMSRSGQAFRNQNASPLMMNDITNEIQQQQVDRSLSNITNQNQYMQRNGSSNNLNNNYKTLLLCENCGQCFMPNDLVDHMALCNPQMQQQLNMTQQQLNMTQQQLNMTQQHHQSMILDKTQLMQQQQQISDEQSETFYKVINGLNYEKQLVEQKLMILENHLKNTENANGIVAQDRDRLKQELDNIMLELGKAKMNQVVQNEEQVACTVALKNEIKFLINKLLKAKGKLSENNSNNTTNLNQTQNMENMSYFNDQFVQSQSGFNPKQMNRKDYSNFSIKGCVDFNTYSNKVNQSQCLVDSTCLKDSNFINPNKSINFDQNSYYTQNQNLLMNMQQNQIPSKKSQQQLQQQRSINMQNISQNSYF